MFLRLVKITLLFIFSFIVAGRTYADDLPTFSEPIDISDQGMFRTIVMNDGSTCLLHLQSMKEIELYCFDKNRKLVSSKKMLSKYLDVNMFHRFIFHGFYEINGQPVLFGEQRGDSKHLFFRTEFDMKTGEISNEELLYDCSPKENYTQFYINVLRSGKVYTITHFVEVTDSGSSKPIYYKHAHGYYSVAFWDEHHTKIKEVPVPVAEASGNDVDVFACKSGVLEPNGDIFLVFSLVTQEGKNSSIVYAMLKGTDTAFRYTISRLGDKYFLIDVDINRYGEEYEMMLSTNTKFYLRTYKAHWENNPNKVSPTQKTPYTCFYTRVNKASGEVEFTRKIKSAFCSAKANEPDRIGITSNDWEPYGIVYINDKLAILSADATEDNAASSFYNACVMFIDSNGRELGGDILPIYQNTGASQHSFELRFNNFIGYTPNGKNFFIVNEEKKGGKALFNYKRSEALLYKVENGLFVKSFLFGEPDESISRAVMIEGADFNHQTNQFASLTAITQKRKTELRMGWKDLSDN